LRHREAVKHQQRPTRHPSPLQHQSRRPPANRHAAVATGWANPPAIQPGTKPHSFRVPRFRASLGALSASGATFADVAFPSTSDRWLRLSGRIAGLFQERLGARESKRRILHATPGLLPFLLWTIPHDPPSSLRFLSVISGLIVVLAAVAYYQFGRVQRSAERRRDIMGAVFGYATVVLATMLLCSQHVEVAFAALAVLAFGDGSATLGGLLARGRRLPWNSKKTIVGTVCFILVATPMAALVYWGQAHDPYQTAGLPRVDLRMALLGALAAAVAAALVESLPVRANDNLRVGITAALVLALFQWVAVGWV
jgi:dolichol kinase